MSTEIVKPQTIDGIEFYVSKDGTKCGVSQIGLARLCGISESPMRRLLDQITNPMDSSVRPYELSKLLEDVQGKECYLALASNQQAKVINAKTAARIIRYYACEAKNKTEIAMFSLGKFAEIGIESWMKQVTSYTEDANTSALLVSMSNTLNLLASDVAEMKAELFLTEGYRAARVTMPGLKKWMEDLDVEKLRQQQLPGDEPLYTLNEWAEKDMAGMVLSRSNKHALANLVSSTYKAMALEMPQKVMRRNAKGHKTPEVQAYPERHFSLLRLCFAQMIASR